LGLVNTFLQRGEHRHGITHDYGKQQPETTWKEKM
jgi:hypothetical protein